MSFDVAYSFMLIPQPVIDAILSALPGTIVALIIGILTFRTTKSKVSAEASTSYSNTAHTAIESQNLLQHQINQLRDESNKKDEKIELLSQRVITLEAEKETLRNEMSERDETIERLVMLTQAQEKEIKQLKARAGKSDTEKARRLSNKP